MTSPSALAWFRELLWTAVLAGGPVVLAAVVVGFVIAILQAATQVSDQSVAFGPKALVVVATLAASGSFMLSRIAQFTERVFAAIAGM